MKLTTDPRSEVYVEFVALYVAEPIISYSVSRSNGGRGRSIASGTRDVTDGC